LRGAPARPTRQSRSRRASHDFGRGHWHRLAGGTSRRTSSTWRPHPVHVGLPHCRHTLRWHITSLPDNSRHPETPAAIRRALHPHRTPGPAVRPPPDRACRLGHGLRRPIVTGALGQVQARQAAGWDSDWDGDSARNWDSDWDSDWDGDWNRDCWYRYGDSNPGPVAEKGSRILRRYPVASVFSGNPVGPLGALRCREALSCAEFQVSFKWFRPRAALVGGPSAAARTRLTVSARVRRAGFFVAFIDRFAEQ
jgi:hypothetical protein